MITTVTRVIRRLIHGQTAAPLMVAAVCAVCVCVTPDMSAARPRLMPEPVAADPSETADSVTVGDIVPDRIPVGAPLPSGSVVTVEEIRLDDGRLVATPVDTVAVERFEPAERSSAADVAAAADSVAVADSISMPEDEWVRRPVEFNPDPTRAAWLSALFPGLGQIYNRRYWKLPIIVGGYLGLAYATDWNNRMLGDYTRAYADLTDNDPSTRSYMDFFPSTTSEDDLNKTWLENTFRSRKNYFRRNRDLCIIGMVGVYLLALVDAYVDASLSHFDISPQLAMDVAPALIQDGRNNLPSVGLLWALTF